MRDMSVCFDDNSTFEQDNVVENITCPAAQDGINEVLDEIAQEAYDTGYDKEQLRLEDIREKLENRLDDLVPASVLPAALGDIVNGMEAAFKAGEERREEDDSEEEEED